MRLVILHEPAESWRGPCWRPLGSSMVVTMLLESASSLLAKPPRLLLVLMPPSMGLSENSSEEFLCNEELRSYFGVLPLQHQ